MTLFIAFILAFSLSQEFKPSPNPVSDAVRDRLARDSKSLVAAAELMPAEKYSYRPTPAQMTFGQLVVHVVQTNFVLCSAVSGAEPPMPPAELKKMSDAEPKDSLVAAIRKSFAYCAEGLAKVTDAQLGEQASMFGRPIPQSRGAAMVTIAVDWADHYSTAASYLRLNGILPPTASPQK
jgi:hypothetical protein